MCEQPRDVAGQTFIEGCEPPSPPPKSQCPVCGGGLRCDECEGDGVIECYNCEGTGDCPECEED
jgi:hypothetical protein